MQASITKAIFPVAGLGTRFLPATKTLPKEMLPVVDTPLIDYAIAEAVAAGITECVFITGRNRSLLESHLADSNSITATFIPQDKPLGLGHAVSLARETIGDEPAAIILPDDFIMPVATTLKEMVTAWKNLGGNMLAAETVPDSDVSLYGIIVPAEEATGNITKTAALMEKPETAPSNLAVIGRYIIEPGVFDELAKSEKGAGGEIQLTDAIARRIGHAPVNAFTIAGARYDCGSKPGFLKANIAMGLGNDSFGATLNDWLADFIKPENP